MVNMESTFLRMRNVSKRYTGVQALDHVDFEINEGEIHCLAGTNGSGKSTLIKIISGEEKPDKGSEIYIRGELSTNRTSIDSIHQGIEIIYQDLSLFPNLTVAENIALGTYISGRKKWVSSKANKVIARKAMEKIHIRIPLDKKVEDLSIADQQLVAICRALTGDLRLLIMDEPTTALTHKEVDALLTVVKELKSKGIAILFISHKLDEVMRVAQKVTILRDGRKAGPYPASDLDSRKIEYLMTGENFKYVRNTDRIAREKPLLELENLTKKNNYKDISLTLFPGEIIGITGPLGSGRTELALSVFGMNPPEKGTIKLNGQQICLNSVRDAVDYGIAYVPENRLVQGLVMEQAISKNTVLTVIEKLLNKLRLINHQQKSETISNLIAAFNIKAPLVRAPVATLSGGNQQRIVLAKWMATEPILLILDGPTVGVDIAAKGAIHETIKCLAKEGIGVIIISDEVAEVVNSCHRVFVMNRGKITAEFKTIESTEEDIRNRMASVDQGSMHEQAV